MGRRKNQTRQEKASGHLTAAQIRKLGREARVRRQTTGLSLRDSLRLARHLSEGCESCWRSAGLVACRLRASLHEPVMGTISRLGHPKSWFELTEVHRFTLRRVRDRPYGFAYAVLEESLTLVVAQALAVDQPAPDPDEFLFWADLLTDELKQTSEDPGSPELVDLSMYKLCRLAEIHHWASKPDDVRECLNEIRTLLPRAAGGPGVKTAVHELEAHLHQENEEWRKASRSYRKAREALSVDDAARRFEIRICETDMLFRSGASPARIEQGYKSALAELLVGDPPSDPVERLAMVHNLVKGARHLAEMAYCWGMRSWPGIPETLRILERAWPLYLVLV